MRTSIDLVGTSSIIIIIITEQQVSLYVCTRVGTSSIIIIIITEQQVSLYVSEQDFAHTVYEKCPWFDSTV